MTINKYTYRFFKQAVIDWLTSRDDDDYDDISKEQIDKVVTELTFANEVWDAIWDTIDKQIRQVFYHDDKGNFVLNIKGDEL